MSDDLHGYYRSPTIRGNHIVFACETDLWSVTAEGGLARRLTDHHVDTHTPFLSPDGQWLAFRGREEGSNEVYVMAAFGGPAKRLTYQSGQCTVVGWTRDGTDILYASDDGLPLGRHYRLWAVSRLGGVPRLLPHGPADRVSYGDGGGVVLGRNVGDPARWKRYRGGLTGDLWVDEEGNGEFRRLVSLAGNLANPMWLKGRIFFISDHEGWGNLYSCTPAGEDLKRHTSHQDYYVRNASTDGERIVYQSGANIHVFDPKNDHNRKLDIQVASSKPQLNRRFVDATRYLDGYDPHPKGLSLLTTNRGKMFAFANWERAVTQHGARDQVRYRLAQHLHDGKNFVCISDESGEEAIEMRPLELPLSGETEVRQLTEIDIGRPTDMLASPTKNQVVLCNHRNELLWVDVDAGEVKRLDRSDHGRIMGMAFSPDGRYVAYGYQGSQRTTHLRLAEIATGNISDLTEPLYYDGDPSFDPTGNYLYFISYRMFNPVHDNLYFDLSFPQGGCICFLTLRKDTQSPLTPEPKALDGSNATKDKPKDGDEEGKDKGKEKGKNETKPKAESDSDSSTEAAASEKSASPTGAEKDKVASKGEPKETRIDLDGISGRVVRLPIAEGVYHRLEAIAGKVLYDRWPTRGTLSHLWDDNDTPQGALLSFDLEKQQEELLASGISSFCVAADRKTMVYRKRGKLRIVKADAKVPETSDKPSRTSGFVDLSRIRISVAPATEWRQMYREAWRLQRDNFWSPTMSGVDWQEVYDRYLPVLARVATRSEFSDLMWEMQGELATSHAYEYGGDHPRRTPGHGAVGRLGAVLNNDSEGRWVIEALLRGDSWLPNADSPLAAPGLDIQPGDHLLAVDHQPVRPEQPPEALLTNLSGTEVDLVVQRPGSEPRKVTVKTLTSERRLRYRAWVNDNRTRVHGASGGEVGYVHVPDMGAYGYAEFHRHFQREVERTGLIVDVRYNGGGNVSELLLQKLALRRIGYQVPRHGAPSPYPSHAILGPLVCLTNEHTGSDGDIFSHSFKLLRLGKLIGKRTWGGVVGIWPRHPLVDRTITTQAEFAFWFEDVGFNVENHGAVPDVDVDITPQDWENGRDPQLQRAIDEALLTIANSSPKMPEFGPHPDRKPPRLKET